MVRDRLIDANEGIRFVGYLTTLYQFQKSGYGPVARPVWTRWWIFVFHKRRGISCLAEWL